jgi:hypothetical protein
MVEGWINCNVGNYKMNSVTEQNRYKQLLSKLDELSKLEQNWDSYDGVPIPEYVIANTKQMLSNLDMSRPWEIVPGGDGSVQIECQFNDCDVEISIHPS